MSNVQNPPRTGPRLDEPATLPQLAVPEPVIATAAPDAKEHHTMVLLIGAGAIITALLLGVIVLYVNVPVGFDSLYGLSPGSATLFRSVIPYPVISLTAGQFTPLAEATFVLLWIVYLGASLGISADRYEGTSARLIAVVLGVAALDSVLLVFMPPVLSSDVYHNILFGRMVAFDHLNPYVVSDAALRNDPAWGLAFWRDVTTHYGPFWTLLSAGLATIGRGNIVLAVLTFKTAGALLHLANGLLVFVVTRELTGGDGIRALLTYTWNPLILLESAGSAHNEVAMMTCALLGCWLAIRRRVIAAMVVLALSVLVTYLTAILVAFVACRLLTLQTTSRERFTIALKSGATLGLTALILYLPFWSGPGIFTRLLEVGARFKTPVRYELREAVAQLLAGGHDSAVFEPIAGQLVSLGLNAAFALFVVFLGWRLVTGKVNRDLRSIWGPVLNAWGVASLVYVAVIYGWFFPWYLMMPMTLVFASPLTRTTHRLAAACNGLGIAWMLLYGALMPK